jgi:hypothetical protein
VAELRAEVAPDEFFVPTQKYVDKQRRMHLPHRRKR